MTLNISDEWLRAVAIGWLAADNDEFEKALRCYEYAEEIADKINGDESLRINPDLCLLRHKSGKASGIIESVPPNEDSIITLEFPPETKESQNAVGMKKTLIDFDSLAKNLDEYCYGAEIYHRKNINNEARHLMVLSTGRSGTISLYHLFEQTNYIPYHSYYFQPTHDHRYEMVCKLINGEGFNTRSEDFWIKTRAAEWIGAQNIGRPIAALNHLDTIFAPTFSCIHPHAKFIYLHRDPVKIFESFYSKGQWSKNQLCPLYFDFNGGFHWRHMRYDLPAEIAWYVKFTETFSRAFGSTIGDYFLEISADKLFAKDEEEIIKLIEFSGIEKSVKEVAEHFSIPYNQKSHKITMTEQQIAHGRKAFEVAYGAL